jgi:hypothetical protein
MAAVSDDEIVQREDLRDERDAQVGRQEGGDGQVTVSGVDSVRVRVHLYERSFPEEPDKRVLSRRDCRGHRLPHRAAHSTVSPISRCLAG